jgi:DNA-binding response OmpR family regulator
LRRCEAPPSPTVIRAGELEIDALAMVLTVRGTVTTATATEFRLLHYLAHHAGRVFTRNQILDAVWKDTAFVSPRSVDVYVRKLRSKIEVDPEQPRYLRTVRGAGYRFESPKK